MKKSPLKSPKSARGAAQSKGRSSTPRARAKSTVATPRARKAPTASKPAAAPPPPTSQEPTESESEAKTTTSLIEIKAWVDQRGGKPVTVKGTAPEHEAGLLRIDFPGYSSESNLEEISWDEWFSKFEEKKLAFLYQEKTRDGGESRFFKLIERSDS